MEPKHFALALLALASGAALGYALGRRGRVRAESGVADEERIAWLQRLSTIGQMMSGIVHEVRTPLATVVLTVEHAQRVLDKGLDPREQLATVAREADRAVEILSDILDFAKPSSLELKPTPLAAVAKAALEPIWIRFDERGVDLWLDIPEDLVVLASTRHLHQVITILLMNALDALPFGGRLELKAARSGGAATLSLKDNGIGIEPAKLKGLFEPFATGRAEQGGTGLGLNVARWIMHKHGGDVVIASEGIGKGTTVTISVPVA